jgi:hypothetical protein
MNYWLAQLFLAARKSNEDKGWVQILVFVILTVFYVLGSIFKAKADKGATGKGQKPGKPVRKSPEDFIDLQRLRQLFGYPERPAPGKQPRQQAAKPQVAKPQVQPTRRKVARPAGGAMLGPQVVMPQVDMPQVQPKLEKVPELTVAMPQVEAAAPVEKQQIKYLSEILSDYEDAEKLRRAILHYEILGKPVSLREQERAF